MKTIIDFSKNVGEIKAVNGVSNGPICHDIDMSEYFKEAHISTVRYHDTDGSAAYGRYMIDISRIFENFEADEYDEKNYSFEHTDKLLLAAKDCNAEIIYRLGESIDHTIRKRYSRPPEDFDKWCRICLQIIKHYNAGWCNGYHLGIRYWEIWNEPEGHATDGTQPMWSGGTFEQMLTLYKKIAFAIKEYDSTLKVGGLSFMYADFAVEPFLRFCQKEHIPVDFLSFHHYAQDIDWLVSQANEARNWLDRYGFADTEIIIAEWALLLLEDYDGTYWDFIADPIHQWEKNKLLFTNQQSNLGASFVAAFLLALNDLPVDKAIYYDFDPNGRWCALFSPYYEPQKPWYALKAYGEMLFNQEYRAVARCDSGYIIAAKGKEQNSVIYSNFRKLKGKNQFTFYGVDEKKRLTIKCIDGTHEYESILEQTVEDGETIEIEVGKSTVLVFEFRA